MVVPADARRRRLGELSQLPRHRRAAHRCDFCAERDLRITCFVVGRDAELRENREALAAIADAGHEIGNHSLNHYPWMHTLSRAEVEAEIVEAEDADRRGDRPAARRFPRPRLQLLRRRCSRSSPHAATCTTRRILPTYIGPLARWYFRRTASRDAAERADRRELFGSFREGLRSIKPYVWTTDSRPDRRNPRHDLSAREAADSHDVPLHLWQFSPRLTRIYLRTAPAACRLLGIGPSILLHPLDFLGGEDDPDLRFFPGMNLPREKLALLDDVLAQLTARFEVVPMHELAQHIWRHHGLPAPVVRRPFSPSPRRGRTSRSHPRVAPSTTMGRITHPSALCAFFCLRWFRTVDLNPDHLLSTNSPSSSSPLSQPRRHQGTDSSPPLFPLAQKLAYRLAH